MCRMAQGHVATNNQSGVKFAAYIVFPAYRSEESLIMPTLTRRRDPDASQETWLIHYGDVRIGTIAERFRPTKLKYQCAASFKKSVSVSSIRRSAPSNQAHRPSSAACRRVPPSGVAIRNRDGRSYR